MGLNWLRTLGRLRAPQRQRKSEQSKACQVERILFIGFGRIPGFYWFNWDDWDWLNAADLDSVYQLWHSLQSVVRLGKRPF